MSATKSSECQQSSVESADSQVLRVERRLEVDVGLVFDVHRLDRVVAAQQEVVGDRKAVRSPDVAVADALVQSEGVIRTPEESDHLVVPPDGLQSPQRHVPATNQLLALSLDQNVRITRRW